MTELFIEVEELPEGVPEKFFDAEGKKINVGNLVKSYTELERNYGLREDQLTETLKPKIEEELRGALRQNVPESPDAYEVQLSDEIKTKVEINSEDPILKWWKDTAHKSGLSQEDFNTGINEYVKMMVASQPNVEEEVKKLGENGKDRVTRVDNWLAANLPDKAAEKIKSLISDADSLIAVEAMIDRASSRRLGGKTGEESSGGKITQESVRKMMRDPRYRAPGEDAYTNEVMRLWQQVSK